MAIKSSNQITFTEYKKIVAIKEWYLATSESSGITKEDSRWSLDIPAIDAEKRYLWNYEEVVYSIGSSDTKDPVIIGVYGDVGASLQIKYISSEAIPTIVDNDVSAWLDAIPTQQEGKSVYMTQKLSNQIDWSTPIQISSMAAPTVEIVNGYWYVNGESTDIKAEGETPSITIGENGNWYIDGVDSGTKAEGPAGKDGTSIEYVYYRSTEEVESFSAPSYTNGKLTTGWTDSPQGITETYKYEYVSIRTKPTGEDWTSFSTPVIWSKWGEKGQDGDGIEYRYYLSNSDKTPTYIENDSKWTDEPTGVSNDNKYEYVVQIKTTNETSIISSPALWAKYSEDGSSLQIKYLNSSTIPTIINNNVSAWSDVMPAPESGKKTYMIQKLSVDTNWSTPIQISAEDGVTPTVTIVNGYWHVNGESTGIKAEGEAPEITIGSNGNWYINGSDSGTKAQGETGKDGSDIEFVYYISKTAATSLSAPSYNSNNILTTGWTKSPSGITEEYKYEYVSMRTKQAGSTSWSSFSTPVIWSKWGEKGQDGDGVEYKYYLSNSSTAPTYNPSDNQWTDDPTGVSITQQYEYVIQIKTINGTQTPAPKASLWAKFGEDGKGIKEIINYYATTTSPDTIPSQSDWEPNNAPALTPTNKYLWNYEVITYTKGDSTETDPAIIGVYGDSGADAITFEIYSTHGFIFKDTLKSITLNIAAFDGEKEITNATYTWEWWDNSLNNGSGGYATIKSGAEKSFVVADDAIYALANLRCTMSYNDKTYEDYVVLTNETVIYTSVVKFFDGSNIFNANDLYLVAYIELYQNNSKVEGISATTYCTGVSSVNSSGIITSNLSGNFEDGTKMYFICKGNTTPYQVILGEYRSGKWTKIDHKTKYLYKNNLYDSSAVDINVIAISKESINKSQNIDFTVYKDNVAISYTYTMVIDSNDPIISDEQPSNKVDQQLWLDTKTNTFYIYSQEKEEWLKCDKQPGGAVYTSMPPTYSEGDLWILADGESCGEFKSGSMLKAIESSTVFNESHWKDADAEMSELKNNINQYFMFDKNNGLKIGQVDENFYVNISSQEMGFYDNSDKSNPNQKVVSIGNNSATIKKPIFKEDAKFENNATFEQQVNMYKPDTTTGFIFKLEENGSLSLAISK